MADIAKVSWKRLPLDVFVEHELGRAQHERMLHQELPCLTAFVADRNGAVQARLQQQVRVADAAAREDDGLRRIDGKLQRGAGRMMKIAQTPNRGSRRIGVESDYRRSERNVNPRGFAQHVEILGAEAGCWANPRERPVDEPWHPGCLDVEGGDAPVQDRGRTRIVRRQRGLGNRPARAGGRVIEVSLHQGGAPACPDSRGAAKRANRVSIPPTVREVSVVDRIQHVRPRLGRSSGLEKQDGLVGLVGQLHGKCHAGRAGTDHEAIVRLTDWNSGRNEHLAYRIARTSGRCAGRRPSSALRASTPGTRPTPGRPGRQARGPARNGLE